MVVQHMGSWVRALFVCTFLLECVLIVPQTAANVHVKEIPSSMYTDHKDPYNGFGYDPTKGGVFDHPDRISETDNIYMTLTCTTMCTGHLKSLIHWTLPGVQCSGYVGGIVEPHHMNGSTAFTIPETPAAVSLELKDYSGTGEADILFPAHVVREPLHPGWICDQVTQFDSGHDHTFHEELWLCVQVLNTSLVPGPTVPEQGYGNLELALNVSHVNTAGVRTYSTVWDSRIEWEADCTLEDEFYLLIFVILISFLIPTLTILFWPLPRAPEDGDVVVVDDDDSDAGEEAEGRSDSIGSGKGRSDTGNGSMNPHRSQRADTRSDTRGLHHLYGNVQTYNGIYRFFENDKETGELTRKQTVAVTAKEANKRRSLAEVGASMSSKSKEFGQDIREKSREMFQQVSSVAQLLKPRTLLGNLWIMLKLLGQLIKSMDVCFWADFTNVLSSISYVFTRFGTDIVYADQNAADMTWIGLGGLMTLSAALYVRAHKYDPAWPPTKIDRWANYTNLFPAYGYTISAVLYMYTSDATINTLVIWLETGFSVLYLFSGSLYLYSWHIVFKESGDSWSTAFKTDAWIWYYVLNTIAGALYLIGNIMGLSIDVVTMVSLEVPRNMARLYSQDGLAFPESTVKTAYQATELYQVADVIYLIEALLGVWATARDLVETDEAEGEGEDETPVEKVESKIKFETDNPIADLEMSTK